MSEYTIACLIQKEPCQYYMGDGPDLRWDNNIHRACLYTPMRAEASLKRIRRKERGAFISCVIQDADFNYYDGHKFVYDLAEAKHYTLEEAEVKRRQLKKT